MTSDGPALLGHGASRGAQFTLSASVALAPPTVCTPAAANHQGWGTRATHWPCPWMAAGVCPHHTLLLEAQVGSAGLFMPVPLSGAAPMGRTWASPPELALLLCSIILPMRAWLCLPPSAFQRSQKLWFFG